MVHATFGSGMIATVLFLIIDSARGVVTLARAGHPPPALRGADGSVRLLETTNTLPLGVDERVTPGEAEYPFAPGETLLLFTDGLIERRRESISVGFDRLREAFAAAPEGVEAICDHVLEQTITEQGSDDDVALLAVRLLPLPAGPLRARRCPPSPRRCPLARHRLRAWLTENVPALDFEARSGLEVAWSEAVTNVVRHAYGPGDATFRAAGRREGNQLWLVVADDGHWRPPRGRHGGRGWCS